MAETIGFIGLGIMGRPMAKNLLKAGYTLVVYDIVPAAMEEVVAAGASPAASSREVAERSDVVITMLPDSPDVEAAMAGPEGVFAGIRRGKTIIDMSTIAPAPARRLAAQANELGVPMLDAPVSGGQAGAIGGTLSIMVGGPADVFAHCLPILQAMGKNIVHIGDAGAGQACKACNQIVVGLNVLAVAEAMVLARKTGIDQAKMRQALMGGSAQSVILERHGQKMLDRNFKPGFRARLHLKDMNIVTATGREYGASLPASALLAELFKSLAASGRGDDDHSSLLRVIEELSGISGEE